jgi:D-glycero-beta-D-manno-heptose-7-phosphate kinase
MNFDQLFIDLSKSKVLVVGDVMLDTYWWGHVDRISPEAPVPIVTLNNKELRVGGAANVALNTVSLGASTAIISVIGDDADGNQLLAMLQEHQIDVAHIISSAKRVTTNKMRVMSRNQQMMRLDAELTTDIDEVLESQLINNITAYINNNNPQVVIFEDYNKGVITKKLIETITTLCVDKNIITAVDPKRKNFLSYKNVTLFKPNLKEVKEGLNLLIDQVDLAHLAVIHEALHNELNHQISFITLSEKGVYFQFNKEKAIIPTHIRNIADVSGAGDTVIAVASLVYATTKNMMLAAEMANIAGGLVCEEVGTAAIDKKKLLDECNLLLNDRV